MLLLPVAGASAASEMHGRLYFEDYYSSDTGSDLFQHLFTTRLRLDITKLNDDGSLAFHFDGRDRQNFGSYSSTTENDRIDAFNLDYTGEVWYLAAGRLWVKEFSVERVDGVNVVAQKRGYGIGVFGGFKPDTYAEMFTADYTSAGAYVFVKKDNLNSSLAFTQNGFKGGTDRQYVYGQTIYQPGGGVLAFGSVTIDINQETMSPGLTSGIFELSYRPDAKKGIIAGYNQFRAYQLWESMDDQVDTGKQESFYLSGNYRFREKYNIYARVERQTRDFESITEEDKKAMNYKAGVNLDNMAGSGVNADISAFLNDGFGTRYATYSADFSRQFMDKIDAAMNASYTHYSYSQSDADSVLAYGLTGNYYISKKWSLSFAYNGDCGSEYCTNSLFTRTAYRF